MGRGSRREDRKHNDELRLLEHDRALEIRQRHRELYSGPFRCPRVSISRGSGALFLLLRHFCVIYGVKTQRAILWDEGQEDWWVSTSYILMARMEPEPSLTFFRPD